VRFLAAVCPALLALAVTTALATGCGAGSSGARRQASEELDAALIPAAVARALRRSGGGHFHATTTFDIVPGSDPDKPEGPRDAVTTTTDVWIDRAGQYRVVETNDRDGGREVVLYGRDLSVGLRYGKMIKRVAREPEPSELLGEALGGPWAAWDVARRFADVDRREDQATGSRTLLYRMNKAPEPRSVKAGFGGASPLRQWRESATVDGLTGAVRLDPTLGFISARMEVTFALQRDGKPLRGLVRSEAYVREWGKVSPIAPPQAEPLEGRQRTILEERALLGRAGQSEPVRPVKGTQAR
jgi:hypothetical protein